MCGGGERAFQPLAVFGALSFDDRLAVGRTRDLHSPAALRLAPVGEKAPRALHLVQRALKQVAVAKRLEAAHEPPAVERKFDAHHAPEKRGVGALLGEAKRVGA